MTTLFVSRNHARLTMLVGSVSMSPSNPSTSSFEVRQKGDVVYGEPCPGHHRNTAEREVEYLVECTKVIGEKPVGEAESFFSATT